MRPEDMSGITKREHMTESKANRDTHRLDDLGEWHDHLWSGGISGGPDDGQGTMGHGANCREFHGH